MMDNNLWLHLDPPYEASKVAQVFNFKSCNRPEYHPMRGNSTVCGIDMNDPAYQGRIIEPGAIRAAMCLKCQEILTKERQQQQLLRQLDRLITQVEEEMAGALANLDAIPFEVEGQIV